jgi:hypothetical protein
MKFFIKVLILFSAVLFSECIQAQSFLQDSLSAISHQHTPLEILSGSGDDSIVCYKS